MPWKRPDSVPVGRVWSRFEGKGRDGKPGQRFEIRDLEDKFKEKCLDMMQETFLRDEPLCKVLDIEADPVSIATIRSNWEEYLRQKVSLACFLEGTEELVAVNFLLVKSVDDDEEDIESVRGEPWKKLLKTLVAAESLVDLFEYYRVEHCLSASGLTVLPEYRGQNIGARMIAAREPLCKAFGIDAVTTVFTAIPSQVLAAKCGYELIAELNYSDMLKYAIDLSRCECQTAKVMGKKFVLK